MIASGHSRYRRHLSLIAGDAEILRIANDCDWRSPERNWHRIHGRFQPDTEPYAVAVFEAEGSPQSIYCVEIFACPPREQASGTGVEHRELGHIRFTSFTSDTSLETLRTVPAAHPELDVATFLQELEIDMPSSVREEICGAFLSGYQTISGRLDANLIAAYVCHKRLYKALSRARGLQPDGDALALESLHHACKSLRSAEEAC